MPSASSKPQVTQQNAPVDLLQEPLKCALSVADKKLRNLEKRRLKLAETKKKADNGEKLNEDQKNALKSLESVDFGLEAVRDVQKLLSNMEQEYTKLLKKDQKRQKQEQKDVLEARGHKYIFDIVDVQAILGEMSEEVRPDFLSGSKGACQLSETELENLDTIYEHINPAVAEGKSNKLTERSRAASHHLISLIESKTSTFVEGVTYKEVNDTLQKIKVSGYFDKEDINGEISLDEIETEPTADEEKPEEDEVVHNEEVKPIEHAEPEPDIAIEEYPQEQPDEDAATVEPINGVDLPPEVQTTPEEEGINFMAESEISAVVQEAPLNPVSPEFVPRKMQPQQEGGFDNEGDSTESNWQQIEGGHNNQGSSYRGRGRGRGNYRGRGGNRGGNSGGSYRGGNREYRGNRGGNRGGSNYRGNRDGGRGNYRGNRDGGRGSYRGGQHQQQQQQQQQ